MRPLSKPTLKVTFIWILTSLTSWIAERLAMLRFRVWGGGKLHPERL